MRLAMKLHFTAIFLAALLAQSPFAVAESATKITWDDHIFALMEGACISCHNPDKTKGGLDLSSYNNLLKGGSSGERDCWRSRIQSPLQGDCPSRRAIYATEQG